MAERRHLAADHENSTRVHSEHSEEWGGGGWVCDAVTFHNGKALSKHKTHEHQIRRLKLLQCACLHAYASAFGVCESVC